MDRQTAIGIILRQLDPADLLLTTTGMISREAFYLDDRIRTFYMLGSMGLLPAFSLGIALLHPDKRTVAMEGDGSILMSLGTTPLIGYEAPKNFHHVILDNGSYQSTGAQPCISGRIDLPTVLAGAGYTEVASVSDPISLDRAFREMVSRDGPTCLHIRIEVSEVPDIPRISHSPEAMRDRFLTTLGVS